MRFVLVAAVTASAASVAAADPTGSVRVAVACDADTLDPSAGLTAAIDGRRVDSLGGTVQQGVAVDGDGTAYRYSYVTDVGLAAPLGRHRLELRAPMCEATSVDIDVTGRADVVVGGRLPLEHRWQGPVGTPSGVGFFVGATAMAAPHGALSGTANLGPGGWTADANGVIAGGALIGITWAHRYLLLESDSAFGWTGLAGTATNGTDSARFHATALSQEFTARVGARIPLHNLEIGAGTGVGLSIWDYASMGVDRQPATGLVESPGGTKVFFHVPLWTELTYKPSCTWGVTAMATYGWDPVQDGGSGVTLTAGVLWQANAACSEGPGLVVR